MKRYLNYLGKQKTLIVVVIAAISLFACENEFSESSHYYEANNEPPVITSVSEATQDYVVTQGVIESTYIIRGENLSTLSAIYFNGFQAGFNPALLTDNIAFVKVPAGAPYLDQPNIMRVENTAGGTDYDFSLLTIEGFTEETVDGVKTVTLLGGDFSDTSTVTFVSGSEENGNLVERPAKIVDITQETVTVEVPSGVEQAYIYLETSRGAIVRSDSYGFSYSIYIDALHEDWEIGGWGGTFDLENTDPALGLYSIKSVREGWSGLTFTVPDISFTAYESITVTIYGGPNMGSVNLAINDFDGNAVHQSLVVTPGQWTKHIIPLSNFYPNGNAPATITRLDFQESTNTGLPQYVFYVDDFGFL